MKKLVYLAGALLLAVILSSCGGGANLKSAPKITVIEKVPNISTPKWVERSQDFWEEKGNYFYRGMSEGMTNVQASRRAAEAAATTALAQQVKATVRNEFTNALESESYNSTTGGYLKDIFFSVVDNLTISGAAVSESFSEHISMASDTENKVYWRSYVLVRINSSDYLKLATAAFNNTKKQTAANQSAKELAQKVEDRFFEIESAKSN